MADFCSKCGADTYVCQVCGCVCCSEEELSEWLYGIPGREKIPGNACPKCAVFVKNRKQQQIGEIIQIKPL